MFRRRFHRPRRSDPLNRLAKVPPASVVVELCSVLDDVLSHVFLLLLVDDCLRGSLHHLLGRGSNASWQDAVSDEILQYKFESFCLILR